MKEALYVTLLSAVQAVADEAGYEVDTTVIGSDDTTTKQLLAHAQRIIKEMADEYPWSKLNASGSITLAAGIADYALPAAFSYYHYDTFWNSSTRWRVLGPLSPQQYAAERGYGLTAEVYKRFQIRGIENNRLVIMPTPGASEDGQIIIFEYIADRCVRPPTWAVGQIITAGDYRFYDGIYYLANTSGTTSGANPTVDGGVTWTEYTGTYNRFLTDADEPLLNQQTLEQGMLERFGEIHGLESIQPRYKEQLQQDFGRDIPGKTLYAGGVASGKLQYGRSGKVIFGSLF